MTNLDFLTVEQVADALGLTNRGVVHAIARGEFPNARKINPDKEKSAWLIPAEDLEKVKKQRGQSAKTD